MDQRSTEERLASLEQRLSRLEARLSPAPPPPNPDPRWEEPAPPPGIAAPPLAPPASPVEPPGSEAEPFPPVQVDGSRRQVQPPPLRSALWPRPPQAGVEAAFTPERIRPAAAAAGADTLEAQVGLKWAGWAGAIIVVIGAALGIKYAYDQQWFAALPPAARLGLMSLGGFALIAAGEVVFRRVGALASAGPFGAGVATLFVVSYAGYRYFELYERDAAFALMAVVTLIGAAVAVRGNLVSIAVLAIVGGNVAPAVLRGDEPRLVPLLAYLLMIQVVALFLAWWGREPKWWALRGVSFATICLWGAPLVLLSHEMSGSERAALLTFCVVYAALFHAELVLSTLRGFKPATARAPGFAVPVPLGGRADDADQLGVGVTFSLLVTAGLTVAVLALTQDRSDLHRGAWVVGLGGCCLVPGLLLPRLARGRDARRGARANTAAVPPSPSAGHLSVGYRIQAAALLVVAVPVALSGVWVTVAWAVLALAFALAGASLNLAVSRWAAVLLWALSALDLLQLTVMSSPAAPIKRIWVVATGQPIPAYVVIASVLTVLGHVIAALVREDWSPATAGRQTLAAAAAAEAATPHATASLSADPHRPDAAGAHAVRADVFRPGGRSVAAGAAAGALNLNYETQPAVPPMRPLAYAGFQALGAFTDLLAALLFCAAVLLALPSIGVTFALLAYGWVLIGAGQVVRSPVLHPLGLLLIATAAGKWLLIDTLGERTSPAFGGRGGAGTYRPIFNPLVAVGTALFASGLALMLVPLRLPTGRKTGWSPGASPAGDPFALGATRARALRGACGFVAVLVMLWIVTMEIDRTFEIRAAAADDVAAALDVSRGKQVAISIAWSVYAVGCVVLGFVVRLAGLRYFGLGLFAATAVKVMLVDLSHVETGYRILSFLGLGLLLLGTSVLYGKLSPRLLGAPPGAGASPPPPPPPREPAASAEDNSPLGS